MAAQLFENSTTHVARALVSLSSHDSEGAKDMASFRWAQQGAYDTLPNAAMPNTFMAHAFDLQDPWSSNKGVATVWLGCVGHLDASKYG